MQRSGKNSWNTGQLSKQRSPSLNIELINGDGHIPWAHASFIASCAALQVIKHASHRSLLAISTRYRLSRISGQARTRMFHLRLNRIASISSKRSSMTNPPIAIAGAVHMTEHRLNQDSSRDGRTQDFGVAMATSSSSFEII
jgi:hypothetical protein